MSPLALLALLAAEPGLATPRHRQDAPLPPQPPIDALQAPTRPHALGEGATVYVNFDGVQLTECNPSDSRRDCSWYNFEQPFPPFSGTVQTQVGVLQAMRNDVAEFGIRVTGTRPLRGNYTMVVYGGSEAEYGALGSAPAGDCDDEVPNQIAFAHLDGDNNAWVNGGATTALHEAGHTWGLDHIDVQGAIMFPSGDNSPTYFRDDCDQVVDGTDLDPGDAACPHLNMEQCGALDRHNAAARLVRLFGPPYVDMEAPPPRAGRARRRAVLPSPRQLRRRLRHHRRPAPPGVLGLGLAERRPPTRRRQRARRPELLGHRPADRDLGLPRRGRRRGRQRDPGRLHDRGGGGSSARPRDERRGLRVPLESRARV